MARQRPFRPSMPPPRHPAAYASVNSGNAAMAGINDGKNTGYNRNNTGYNTGNHMYSNQYGTRAHVGQGYGTHHNPAADLAALTHGFQGMALQGSSFATQAKNVMMTPAAGNYGGLPVGTSMPSSMYGGSQYIFPNSYGGSTTTQAPAMYTPHVPQYMPPMGYQGYPNHENSPLPHPNWTPTTGTAGEGVPTLITPRRDSVSSNENDQPPTPSYGYPAYGQAGVAINRSPSAVFTHSTPSPTSMVGPYGMALVKQPDLSDVSPKIRMLVQQEPHIPRAIPAPSSPLKPLDRALENQRGETNVYIRGLLPETSDEILQTWGSRFGDIKSSKSILDLNSGMCKGFGFIKYHNYEDAENCIRGFHHLGYEVSFARESFYSKLKAFQNDNNTNLYVSNLPVTMNEHELSQLFHPYEVASAKVLRDQKTGQGRGVGFARFESRDVCEEVMKKFNNFSIPTSDGETSQIQIRYADTQEQKSLKQQTQAARQFRSAEYEYATQAWRQNRITGADNQSGNEFEQYLGTTATLPIHGQRWAKYGCSRGLLGRSPLGGLPTATTTPAPLVQVNVASDSDAGQATAGAGTTDAKVSMASPSAAQAAAPVESGGISDKE